MSLYGLFADANTINQHLTLAAGILPQGGLDIVQDQVNRITFKGSATLGFGFLFGLALAFWSANAGMKAIVGGKKPLGKRGAAMADTVGPAAD